MVEVSREGRHICCWIGYLSATLHCCSQPWWLSSCIHSLLPWSQFPKCSTLWKSNYALGSVSNWEFLGMCHPENWICMCLLVFWGPSLSKLIWVDKKNRDKKGKFSDLKKWNWKATLSGQWTIIPKALASLRFNLLFCCNTLLKCSV